jgi:low temperature requirement protein LtrA
MLLTYCSSERTEVACFELFVDLLYVGILAINGDHAAEDPNGYELLRFSITFIMSWKIWSDLALIISWFETDDIMQRLSVMIIMACLLGLVPPFQTIHHQVLTKHDHRLTTNMLDAFDDTYSMLIAFYLAARLFMGAYYFCLAWVIPMVRGVMLVHVSLTLIPTAIWIASIHVDMPRRLGLIWAAIVFELSAGMLVMLIVRKPDYHPRPIREWMGRVFEFLPAINIEHKVERTNA